MCVPSLNEICESIFELSHTQAKTYSSRDGTRDVKPVYPQLSAGNIMGKWENLDYFLCIQEFTQMTPTI